LLSIFSSDGGALRRSISGLVFVAFAVTMQPSAHAAQNDCGQPLSSGDNPTASDALFVLNAAVGLQTCDPCVCDTDASGAVTAADALRTLSVAVGAGIPLACEPCSTPIELDCEREGYPCTIADSDPDALDKITTLLVELWDIRNAGSMGDVHAYLATHPDVIDTDGDNQFASFRVAGAPPAVFQDATASRPAAPAVMRREVRAPEPVREVVGEDSSGDGKVDNRDSKRAIVLAPYEWQFAPYDESEDLAARLEMLEAYKDNVVFKRNATNGDANVAIEDWLGLGNYDVIVVSTHGSRKCNDTCKVWISSGVPWDFLDKPQISIAGAVVKGLYDDEFATRTQGWLALGLDFFRYFYAGGLDNRLVTFSACETGNFEGRELSAALGGDNFVMTGWTEVVPSDAAFATALAFYEELAKGLSTTEAFDIVDGLGLFPVFNDDGILTSFDAFSPTGDEVRIVELPRLVHEGETVTDGTNLAALVTGTLGDGNADSMELTVHIDGVTEQSRGDFQVRYRIDDRDVAGSYDLASATVVPGYENRYEVVHQVDLGFDLMAGDLPIEVIVDLPEGGDSRFSVDAKLASCSFSLHLSGDRAADFDGPAQFQIRQDGALEITLRNRARINQDFVNGAQASFTTEPGFPLMPGAYFAATGSVTFFGDGYTGVYVSGDSAADCPSCGGSIAIDSYDEEAVSGSASITMVAPDPAPPEPIKPTVLMDIEFNAAFGSQFDGSSAYSRCAVEYEE